MKISKIAFPKYCDFRAQKNCISSSELVELEKLSVYRDRKKELSVHRESRACERTELSSFSRLCHATSSG